MDLSCIFIAFIAVFFVCIVFACLIDSRRAPIEIKGAHVVITGGSSGIGKEVARLATKKGANVTILARNTKKLQSTIDELKKEAHHGQKLAMVSLDVSTVSCQEIRSSLQSIIGNLGPVKVLVHCAGFSVPGRAWQVSEEDVKRMMDVNYLGSVKVSQALLPDMIANRNGAVIFTSSVAGLVGVYGLAPYCGSKFAIRGYAEALAAEMEPFDIRVSVNCPPDTDTPGFETEQATKPEETKLISEGAGLFQPEEVAQTLLEDGLRGKFLSSNGLDGWLSSHLTIGMAPSNLKDLLLQVSFLGLMRLIVYGYLKYFSYLIQKCHRRRESAKKTE